MAFNEITDKVTSITAKVIVNGENAKKEEVEGTICQNEGRESGDRREYKVVEDRGSSP